MGRVLIVDDDARVRSGLRLTLTDADHDVLEASEADEALELLRSRRVDVLISDEYMPIMRGHELLRVAAAKFPCVMRLMLTGRAELDVAVEAINSGSVFRFLRKPCPSEVLLQAVDEALRERRLKRATELMIEAGRRAQASSGAAFPAIQGPKTVVVDARWASLQALSPRQREVAQAIVAGERIAELAGRLHVSEHTVRNHLKAIFRRLGVSSQLELRERFR